MKRTKTIYSLANTNTTVEAERIALSNVAELAERYDADHHFTRGVSGETYSNRLVFDHDTGFVGDWLVSYHNDILIFSDKTFTTLFNEIGTTSWEEQTHILKTSIGLNGSAEASLSMPA